MTDAADLPLTLDFRDPAHTAKWLETAESARPWRAEVRRVIADRVRGRRRILELGPGPGWLAETILDTCDVDQYVVFDFAQPMLDMCRERLGTRVTAVLGDFKADADWTRRFESKFDAVVAMQSVHELRHKRHAPRLYRQVREILDGILIVADHEPRPDVLPGLHATLDEQHAAMRSAGYEAIETIATFKDGTYYVVSAKTSADRSQ